MIILTAMPCLNCANYRGVKRVGAEEETEFVKCAASPNYNAAKILIVRGRNIHCDYQRKIYDD